MLFGPCLQHPASPTCFRQGLPVTILGTVLSQCILSFLRAQAIPLHWLLLNGPSLFVLLCKEMAESKQDMLRSAWLDAEEGYLSGREQAKAWALREIWSKDGKGEYGMYSFIASKVKKTRNGKPNGPCFQDRATIVKSDAHGWYSLWTIRLLVTRYAVVFFVSPVVADAG